MTQKTKLSIMGIPGRVQTFIAKIIELVSVKSFKTPGITTLFKTTGRTTLSKTTGRTTLSKTTGK